MLALHQVCALYPEYCTYAAWLWSGPNCNASSGATAAKSARELCFLRDVGIGINIAASDSQGF